jgi:periplasmic protein TonB
MHTGAGLAGPGIAGLDTGRLRPLALALLASLALHVLVLYALPILEESIRAPARPLAARLAKPAPEPARAGPPPQPSLPSPPRPAPVIKAAPRIAAPAPVAPVPGVEPAKPAAEPASVVPAQEVKAAAPSAPQPAASAASGPDPGTIARYRLELMTVAPRYKRYPRVAQDNNWEGRVELRIAIGGDGAISSFTVRKSTGRTVLDDEAQAMLRTAHANVAVPSALRGKAFTLEIAVDFFLKDEK